MARFAPELQVGHQGNFERGRRGLRSPALAQPLSAAER
jgi:hypothetical protein